MFAISFREIKERTELKQRLQYTVRSFLPKINFYFL